MNLNSSDLERLQLEAMANEQEVLVGALILRSDGRLFAQKRSAGRNLFPGCWDIVGGHIKPGEDLVHALRREIQEETGWVLGEILDFIGVFDWTSPTTEGTKRAREFEFLVRIENEKIPPRAEGNNTTEFRWFSDDELSALLESRGPGDDFLVRLFAKAFALAKGRALA